MILLKIPNFEPNSPAASKNNWLLGSFVLAASGTSLKSFFRLYERKLMVVLIIWLPQRYHHSTISLTIRQLVFS